MKKFLAIATVAIFLFAGLLVWGAVTAYNFLEPYKNSVITQEKFDLLQTKVKQASNLSLFQCWQKAQSIFSNELWLSFPIANTIESLKLACFQLPANEWHEQPTSSKKNQQIVLLKGALYDKH